MAAGFEDVVEAEDVAFDVGVGVLDAVTHAGLGGEVYYNIELVFSKQLIHQILVGY